jgi:hypothetical protein
MASAYGISTSNVLNSISGMILKTTIDSLHGRSKKSMHPDSENIDDPFDPDDESQMEEELPISSSSSQRVNGKNSCVDITEDLLAIMSALHNYLDLYIVRFGFSTLLHTTQQPHHTKDTNKISSM